MTFICFVSLCCREWYKECMQEHFGYKLTTTVVLLCWLMLPSNLHLQQLIADWCNKKTVQGRSSSCRRTIQYNTYSTTLAWQLIFDASYPVNLNNEDYCVSYPIKFTTLFILFIYFTVINHENNPQIFSSGHIA